MSDSNGAARAILRTVLLGGLVSIAGGAGIGQVAPVSAPDAALLAVVANDPILFPDSPNKVFVAPPTPEKPNFASPAANCAALLD